MKRTVPSAITSSFLQRESGSTITVLQVSMLARIRFSPHIASYVTARILSGAPFTVCRGLHGRIGRDGTGTMKRGEGSERTLEEWDSTEAAQAMPQ